MHGDRIELTHQRNAVAEKILSAVCDLQPALIQIKVYGVDISPIALDIEPILISIRPHMETIGPQAISIGPSLINVSPPRSHFCLPCNNSCVAEKPFLRNGRRPILRKVAELSTTKALACGDIS